MYILASNILTFGTIYVLHFLMHCFNVLLEMVFTPQCCVVTAILTARYSMIRFTIYNPFGRLLHFKDQILTFFPGQVFGILLYYVSTT